MKPNMHKSGDPIVQPAALIARLNEILTPWERVQDPDDFVKGYLCGMSRAIGIIQGELTTNERDAAG